MSEPGVFTLHRGTRPLLVSVPHVGTEIPPALAERLLPRAAHVEDTDWHLEPLYGFVREMGGSLLVPRYSRYVIDLNRPPENTPMYPGQNNTELVPTRFFTGEPLYRAGQAPTDAEVATRVQRYWRPYHNALAGELERLRAAHGRAVLLDGHSIASELPWLFDGKLPDLNLGTADGAACAPALREALCATLQAQGRFSHVVDGR
ncbi:MAG: N-formylglutamate amidohydrolase, partial [Rubrivivax sp.]